MPRDNGPKHNILSCVSKGKKLVAFDKQRKKWELQMATEHEASYTADVIDKRGYILTDYWEKIT